MLRKFTEVFCNNALCVCIFCIVALIFSCDGLYFIGSKHSMFTLPIADNVIYKLYCLHFLKNMCRNLICRCSKPSCRWQSRYVPVFKCSGISCLLCYGPDVTQQPISFIKNTLALVWNIHNMLQSALETECHINWRCFMFFNKLIVVNY